MGSPRSRSSKMGFILQLLHLGLGGSLSYKLCGVPSYKGTNPIMRASPSCPHLNLIPTQTPHLYILSHWGADEGFNTWIVVGM